LSDPLGGLIELKMDRSTNLTYGQIADAQLRLADKAIADLTRERDELRAENERLKVEKPDWWAVIAENERLRAALDTLALALTEHHHQWTNDERSLYEKATSVRSSAGTAARTDSA